jgi:hypothetical protein
MKLVAKVILIIIFIPVFLVFLLAINLRFQLLAPSFWEKSFVSGDVYSKLSLEINNNLESQVITQGGKVGDVTILTDLTSVANLQDTINKNINNFLEYANGKSGEIIVYIPVGKIPKSLLSQNFSLISEQVTLPELFKEFNVTEISPAQIQMISYFGQISSIGLLLAALLLVLILSLLYLLVRPGQRLLAPGIALILSGIFGMAVVFLGTLIQNSWTENLTGSSGTMSLFTGIIIPPIMGGVLKMWSPFAIGAIILGIVLLFLKRSYNRNRKR